MPNTKDYNPIEYGLSVSVTGPPGSGKSHLGRTLVQAMPTFGFIAPSSELSLYGGCDMDYELLMDEGWKPSLNSFKTDSYARLMRKIDELEKAPEGKYKALLFDTMSAGVSEAVWRMVLSGYSTDDPRTLGGNSRQPYVLYGSRMKEFFDRLDLLRYRKHLHMVFLWHEDVREIEGLGTPRKESEKVGQDFKMVVKWDVGRLPEMYGSLRQTVQKWVDLAFFAEPVVGSTPFRCKLIVTPDQTRMAKSRLPIVEELRKLPNGVPNDFPTLLRAVEMAYKKGGK